MWPTMSSRQRIRSLKTIAKWFLKWKLRWKIYRTLQLDGDPTFTSLQTGVEKWGASVYSSHAISLEKTSLELSIFHVVLFDVCNYLLRCSAKRFYWINWRSLWLIVKILIKVHQARLPTSRNTTKFALGFCKLKWFYPFHFKSLRRFQRKLLKFVGGFIFNSLRPWTRTWCRMMDQRVRRGSDRRTLTSKQWSGIFQSRFTQRIRLKFSIQVARMRWYWNEFS